MIGPLLVFVTALPVLEQTGGFYRGPVSTWLEEMVFDERQVAWTEVRLGDDGVVVSTILLPCAHIGAGTQMVYGLPMGAWYETMVWKRDSSKTLGRDYVWQTRAATREQALEQHAEACEWAGREYCLQ